MIASELYFKKYKNKNVLKNYNYMKMKMIA